VTFPDAGPAECTVVSVPFEILRGFESGRSRNPVRRLVLTQWQKRDGGKKDAASVFEEPRSLADSRSVIAVRGMRSLALWSVVLVVLGLTGCGGSSSARSSEDYPLVEQTPPKWQPPVKMPDGSVVRLPAPPTVYETDPSPTCEREFATFHDGSRPTRRPVVIPPRVGLQALAISKRTTRLEWSFHALPADCRPVTVLVSVRNGSDPRATPTTKQVPVHGLTGSTEISYPDFLPPPDVASASAYSLQGRRSRTVSVLIRRPANLPLDSPEPPPPVTARAGKPIACTAAERVVTDPVGDILTYQPGSPPARVRELTPELSAIDIRRAAVRIDGRTICASFVFARPSGGVDIQLTLSLRDASTPSCCASLRFRRTAGRLEVGSDAYTENGTRRELRPVTGAGAEVRDNRLVITGALPPPTAWPFATRRMPTAENIGWSVTTRYFAEKYGPYFGDWLPGHDAVNEPIIRHYDGATVRPNATP
jgi:hypothetical protein